MSPSATRLRRPHRWRLTVALLAIAVACAVVLGVILPQLAQPCVLYGSAVPPSDPLRSMLPARYTTPESVVAARRCLDGMSTSRELVVTSIDNLFALTYGGGLALWLRTLAQRVAVASIVATLLRCGAVCFAVAAAFDLVENQITAVLLFLPDDAVGGSLISLARLCAMPKYVLSLVVGPSLAQLAGAIAPLSRR